MEATPIGIDAGAGWSVVDPAVSFDDGQLELTWPVRRSRVVVESSSEIARERRRVESAAGQSTRRGRRRTPSRLTPRQRAAPRSTSDVDEAVRSLTRFGTTDVADDLLATIAPPVLEQLRQSHETRCLLAIAPGVLARTPLDDSVLDLLRAETLVEASRPGDALRLLGAGPRNTTFALARVALLRSLGRDARIADDLETINNIDTSTALLCIDRGVSLARLGRHSAASAAFSEATRLTRNGPVVRRRAILARCVANVERGYFGRAFVDLERLDTADVDGLALAVRRLGRLRR